MGNSQNTRKEDQRMQRRKLRCHLMHVMLKFQGQTFGTVVMELVWVPSPIPYCCTRPPSPEPTFHLRIFLRGNSLWHSILVSPTQERDSDSVFGSCLWPDVVPSAVGIQGASQQKELLALHSFLSLALQTETNNGKLKKKLSRTRKVLE